MAKQPQPQTLLLDLIAPRPRVTDDAVAALAPADWALLLRIARQHRLEPLLHWQLTRTRPGLSVPDDVREALATRFVQSTRRALELRRELILVHRHLAQRGIPYQALKGAFLAFHVYPQPGLRPLRDLDILVPRAHALSAFASLLEGGWVRSPRDPGAPEARMKIHKHLPQLYSASGRTMIELHVRLTSPSPQGGRPDASEVPGYWQRSVTRSEGRDALSYPSPTDLLLHLIVHAAVDHQFNNGPLVLSDIAYLLAAETIDWIRFWKLAQQDGDARACWLTLRLVQQYWGPQSIAWPSSAAPPSGLDNILARSAHLMLRDASASRDVLLANALQRQGSNYSKLGLLLRKLFPPRTRIVAEYPVRKGSPAVYWSYLRHLWRLTFQRLPSYLKAGRRDTTRQETRDVALLVRWLEAPDAET